MFLRKNNQVRRAQTNLVHKSHANTNLDTNKRYVAEHTMPRKGTKRSNDEGEPEPFMQAEWKELTICGKCCNGYRTLKGHRGGVTEPQCTYECPGPPNCPLQREGAPAHWQDKFQRKHKVKAKARRQAAVGCATATDLNLLCGAGTSLGSFGDDPEPVVKARKRRKQRMDHQQIQQRYGSLQVGPLHCWNSHSPIVPNYRQLAACRIWVGHRRQPSR